MSSRSSGVRDARLDFRLSAEQKRVIEQAASVSGQSVSDFAVSHLLRAARQTVDEATVTRLSARDRERFLALVASDAAPNRALKAAAKRYRERRA